MLQIEHISKSFENHQALNDICLTVERGKVFGLLGPNGAGKSTLIRIVNRILRPDSGHVLFDGHEMTDDDVCHIGYLPEERGLYRKMKVGEQAIYMGRLKGLSQRDAEKQMRWWMEHLGIEEWIDRPVQQLSKGMQQKVQFIVTVLHHPPLIIFDEPFSGFDPVNANVLKKEILRLRDEGTTVVFSSHDMASVEELCDNIALLHHSQVVLTGSMSEMHQRYPDMTMNEIFIKTVENK